MERNWKYCGREYPFDISDSDCVRRMNNALAALREDYAEIEEKSDTVQAIDNQCEMIGEFFGTVFGDAQAKAICGERNSLEAYTTAYVEFIMFVNDQLEELAKFREAIEKRITERLSKRIANLGGEADSAQEGA